MGKFYASMTGTAVFQLKDMPEQPIEYAGVVNFFWSPPKGDNTPQPTGEAVRAWLAQAFEEEPVEVLCSDDLFKGLGPFITIRFATHEQAERVVARIKAKDRLLALQHLGSDFCYNAKR